MRPDLHNDAETFAVIGAAMEVHSVLGSGFLEAAYQDALELEFKAKGIPYLREERVPISYKSQILATPYRADFVCFNSIIVELKAIKALVKRDYAQVIHYLNATGYDRGLLFNFGTASLEKKRFMNSKNRQRQESAKQAQGANVDK